MLNGHFIFPWPNLGQMGSFQKPCLYNTLDSHEKPLFSISNGGHLCLDKMLTLSLLSILCCLVLQVKILINKMLKTRFSTEILPRVAAEKRECPPIKGCCSYPLWILDQRKRSKSSFGIISGLLCAHTSQLCLLPLLLLSDGKLFACSAKAKSFGYNFVYFWGFLACFPEL